MGLRVTFVSGLRRSGKSAVIRTMLSELFTDPPHYVRVIPAQGDQHPPVFPSSSPRESGVATSRWVEFSGSDVFEILPETMTAIQREDPDGSVVIEADSDPGLRCAYAYDHRVFVMPVPTRISEVFRDPSQAASELQNVLEDTAAFASEIFGLFSEGDTDDPLPSEDRAELTGTTMRSFLYSPLGDELATRIQLKPDYHGMVESDVIIVNTGAGQAGPDSAECIRRIGQLTERVRTVGADPPVLFHCDPSDPRGSDCRLLLNALKPFCRKGKP